MILLVLIRLPVFLYGYPLMVPEVLWQLTGIRLSEGFVMYRDLYEGIDPMAAGTYYLLSEFFGSGQIVFQIFSLFLVLIQAVIFNFILNIHNLFPDKTYVPALVYVVFSSLVFDFYTLSPVLLGTTFLLLSLHFILLLIRTGDNDENIFYTGILISVASLFYLPLSLFLFLAILSFLFFTPATIRKYFILAMGFLFPFLCIGTYYFLRDGLDEFIEVLLYSLHYDTDLLVSIKTVGLILILPGILLAAAFFIISSQSRYINYQYITIRIFGFWLLLAVLTFYFTRRFSSYQIFIMVPALAFFVSHYFLLVKNKYVREISFLVFLITTLWINYAYLYKFNHGIVPEGYQNLILKPVKNFPFEMKHNKVLVLGENKAYYRNNRLATPYLNWNLAKKDFADLNNYKNLNHIYDNFVKDMPEVIVDEENIVPELFARIPSFAADYRKTKGYNVYIRKKRD